MAGNRSEGWEKLLEGYPWFNCEGCYQLPAYSEFMPSPQVGQKPLGEIDVRVFDKNDPFGWKITELEEEFELRPGIVHVGRQIMNSLLKLGKGQKAVHINGHFRQNLINNPYWPEELSSRTATLNHERFITLLPMMLSRTQDDKGRVTWTFFGNSIHDPEPAFWNGFYSAPGLELPPEKFTAFFSWLLNRVYHEPVTDEKTLTDAAFRILPVKTDSQLPTWCRRFLLTDEDSFAGVKYLLTFRPFSLLPEEVKGLYFAGKLNLIPFPGSMVFWGMPTFQKLSSKLATARQIPLQLLVARNRGIGTLRVTQTGWIHDPRPDARHSVDEELISDSFHRTHRWQRVHRYQDELNQTTAEKVKIVNALFSTKPDSMGLYNKPMARNCQITDHNFDLVLDGPSADKKKIAEAEKCLLAGGLFGYRFFYPPMKVGPYEVYWHRPLVAFHDPEKDNIEVHPDQLGGYLAAYHQKDKMMTSPELLWPRILRRDIYLSAMLDFISLHDHFRFQTPKNILALLDCWQLMDEKKLSRSFAHKVLNLPKGKTMEQWFDELSMHTAKPEAAGKMKKFLEGIIEAPGEKQLPEPMTYVFTANRDFETAWWSNIKFLAHGEFLNKDNADVATDDITKSIVGKSTRDLENVGDYFLKRHRKSISEAGMEGKALCGELPFRWNTDFDYSIYGGWKGNQKGSHYERNILVIIPGKNRKEAVVLGDHYDTAYMEDIYEVARGGSGARLSANGADDNYSASTTLLLAAPIFLKMAKEGKLERDIWLIHLTGEEFPSDCMGARNFCRTMIEKNIKLKLADGTEHDISGTVIKGVYIMDMIGHNRENGQDIFQISPGKSAASLGLAEEAHIANMIWNRLSKDWNYQTERAKLERGKRISGEKKIPDMARFPQLNGEVRTPFNPHSSIFNTDGQIFSDVGIPVVLFMENYDINRTGYHDTHDTMENIDLDYGSAFASIAIESIARVAVKKNL
jgi:hypothetical protein